MVATTVPIGSAPAQSPAAHIQPGTPSANVPMANSVATSGGLRPVPRSQQTVATPRHHDPQRPGWNLKWRPSSRAKLASSTDHQDVRQTPTKGKTVGGLQAAHQPPQLQSIEPGLIPALNGAPVQGFGSDVKAPEAAVPEAAAPDAAVPEFTAPEFTAPEFTAADVTAPEVAPFNAFANAAVKQTQAQSRGGRRPNAGDFFSDPFGSGSTPPPGTQPVMRAQNEMLLPPPRNRAADPTLPSDSRPMNELRSQAERLREQPGSPGARGLQVPDSLSPANDLPRLPSSGGADSPTEGIRQGDQPSLEQPRFDQPSLDQPRLDPREQRDSGDSRLRVDPRNTPSEPGPSIGDMLRDRSPDDGRSQRDSGDREMFEDPFRDQRDEEDRDRLNRPSEESESDQERPRYGSDQDRMNPTPLQCEDFRQRIAEQTIDQISLDISPPYRPDEIDLDRYKRLKEDFDEKQSIRQWRSIDGRPLASGRLRDLAYERAVIETESGATEELSIGRLSEADIAYIAENWGLPQECLIEQVAYTPRQWTPTTMTYMASNLCHNPLYFEDVNLERYGHTRGPVLEPMMQTAHFFGSIVVLPYKMGVHTPGECQYALGYYRPGNCAPWITPAIPISARGAIAQAATMTGFFWLVP